MSRPYLKPEDDPSKIEFYEGLVRKTASMYEGIVQEEFEDLCSILRIKAWRALESFDPARSKLGVKSHVFGCVRNQVKDLLKRDRNRDGTLKKPVPLYIEDIAPSEDQQYGDGDASARQRFEADYLRTEEEEVFAEILAETPLIPSTLTATERQVVVCLYLEYSHADIEAALDIPRREIASTVKSIKSKMSDWRPDAAEGTARHEGGPIGEEGEQVPETA